MRRRVAARGRVAARVWRKSLDRSNLKRERVLLLSGRQEADPPRQGLLDQRRRRGQGRLIEPDVESVRPKGLRGARRK